jgi:type II secretory pathway pseudopilin PulG
MLSRNTLSHFRSSRIFHTGAFTLVEILVVIAVLVTTSTMAFVSYSEYSTSARDANRVTDLSAFQSGLESYRAKNGVLPEPTSAVRIQTGSTDIAYQGYVGADILQKLAVDRGGMDPKSGTYYTYLAN